MEFQLLGSVEVSVNGCLVDAGRPRQRMVLAALPAVHWLRRRDERLGLA